MDLNNFVNWSLLSNPMNWIIVVLMLAMVTFGLSLALNNKPGFVTGV